MAPNFKCKFLKEGQLSGIRLENYSVNKNDSFNVNNRGELTTGEYVSYLGFLENPEIRRAGRFPKINPTRQDYSKLVKITEDLGLDL
jgi:hypothetical protein